MAHDSEIAGLGSEPGPASRLRQLRAQARKRQDGPPPPLSSCVTLGHWPTLSEPIFSLANGDNSMYYMSGNEDKMKITTTSAKETL